MTPTDNPLTALREVDPGTIAQLRATLADRAADAGLLDLAYRRVDSPVGPLLLVASERGLVRVAFASQDHDRVLADLAATLSPRVLEAPRRLDLAARELEEYFAGTRRAFDLPLDRSGAASFRLQVQQLLPTIGYGRTVSYTELARLAGRPRAVRAVGSACATNPLPIVVPCHRVLRNDGGLGGYLGGLAAKQLLLELESSVSR